MSLKDIEKEYFFKKDRELIESRKEKEKREMISNILNQEGAHCGSCGGQMKDKNLDGVEYKTCTNCSTVSLSMESIDKLYKEHKFSRFKFTLDKQKERQELLKSIEEVG